MSSNKNAKLAGKSADENLKRNEIFLPQRSSSRDSIAELPPHYLPANANPRVLSYYGPIRSVLKNDSLTESKKHQVIRRRKKTQLGEPSKQDVRRKRFIETWLKEHSRESALNLKGNIQRERIHNAIKELKEQNVKVCAFYLETATVETVAGDKRQLPIWIGATAPGDVEVEIIFNKIIRFPKASVVDYGDISLGLSWEVTKGAEHFVIVRKQFMEKLMSYDRIVVAGGMSDFISLGFTDDDLASIKHKIRDVSSFYESRLSLPTVSLKYIVASLFAKVIQNSEHSPIVNAGWALFSYLIDYKEFELAHRTLKKELHCSKR